MCIELTQKEVLYQKALTCMQDFSTQKDIMGCRKALDYFIQSFEAGNKEAAFYIGILYYNSYPGIFQNTEKAFHFFEIASNEGLNLAHYYLAMCYYYGHGVEQNYYKARDLFEKLYKEKSVPDSAKFLYQIYSNNLVNDKVINPSEYLNYISKYDINYIISVHANNAIKNSNKLKMED